MILPFYWPCLDYTWGVGEWRSHPSGVSRACAGTGMCFSLDWSSTSVHYRHVFLRMFWQSSDMLLQKLSFDFTAYQGEGNKIQTITWHISLIAPACLCPLLSGTGLFFFSADCLPPSFGPLWCPHPFEFKSDPSTSGECGPASEVIFPGSGEEQCWSKGPLSCGGLWPCTVLPPGPESKHSSLGLYVGCLRESCVLQFRALGHCLPFPVRLD